MYRMSMITMSQLQRHSSLIRQERQEGIQSSRIFTEVYSGERLCIIHHELQHWNSKILKIPTHEIKHSYCEFERLKLS